MRVVYIADDGKQFDNEWDCEDYEIRKTHPEFNTISFILEDESVHSGLHNFDDFIYDHCIRIIVPTDEAAAALRWAAQYYGFCYFKQITEAGVWEYQEQGWDSKFVKTHGVEEKA